MATKFIQITFVFIFLFQAFMPSAAYSNDDVYTIDRYEVTLEQRNTSRARQEAINLATRGGFEQLLKSLTAQSAWEKHEEALANTDYNQVLERFDILEETTTPTYKATFKLDFNRAYIRTLLQQYAIPFTEVSAGTVLLLPLLDLHNSSLLWEETNPWRVKLEEAAKKSGLVTFVFPIGDPQEMMMLTPEMVAFGATDMILDIAKKYNASAAVVARFQMGLDNTGQREALLDLTWHGEKAEPQYLQVPLQNQDGLDAAMSGVAVKAIQALEEAWRKLYIVELDKPDRLLVHYKVNQLAAIEALRKQLSGVAIVNDVLLRAVSREQAVFQVNFYGTPEKLKALAEEQNLALLNWGTHWVVGLGSVEENTNAYGPQPEQPAYANPYLTEEAFDDGE